MDDLDYLMVSPEGNYLTLETVKTLAEDAGYLSVGEMKQLAKDDGKLASDSLFFRCCCCCFLYPSVTACGRVLLMSRPTHLICIYTHTHTHSYSLGEYLTITDIQRLAADAGYLTAAQARELASQ